MGLKGWLPACLAVLVFLITGACAHAEEGESVTVATPQLAHLIEHDGSGVYQQLLKRALESLDVKVEPVFYPHRRALRMFEKSRVDCLLSLTNVLRQRAGNEDLLYSYPLGRFRFHIFTLAEDAPIESIKELEGRVVGSIKGHEAYLTSLMAGSVDPESVRSEIQAIQMLRMGRLDALIAAIPDIRPSLDRLSYAPDQPLLEGFDRINCHNTGKNRAFVQSVSGELRRLHESGVYQEVLGALYVPFEVAH